MELRVCFVFVRVFSGVSIFVVISEKKWIELDLIVKLEGRVGGEGCLRFLVLVMYLIFWKVEVRL